MSPYPLRAASLCGILTLTLTAGTASAQWYPVSADCYCRRPQQVANNCYQAIPMTAYRNVPVTEYRQVKQTVKQPVYDVKWEDREVTAYRPETETKTAEVPTVTYDTVTENQTVYQNQGYWGTQLQYRPKVTPCQYDPRPSLMGWLNRTAYSIRSTFTPTVIPRRQYVSNVVARTIPVTRQVARTEKRKVTYNVTTMKPYKTKEKVAVRTVKYVDREIVRTQPVTVMRSVPIGTRYAYAPYSVSPTQTALSPTPDPIGAQKSESSGRTANSEDDRFGNESGGGASNMFGGDDSALFVPGTKQTPTRDPEVRKALDGWMVQEHSSAGKATIARAGYWFVRGATVRTAAKPVLKAPGIAVADSNQ